MKDRVSLKEVAKMAGVSVKTMKIRVTTGKFKQPDLRENGELFWYKESLAGITVNQPNPVGTAEAV